MLVHALEKGAQLHCVWPRNGLRAGFPNRPCFSLPQGYPPIIHFHGIFHEINHLFWGTPISGNLQDGVPTHLEI